MFLLRCYYFRSSTHSHFIYLILASSNHLLGLHSVDSDILHLFQQLGTTTSDREAAAAAAAAGVESPRTTSDDDDETSEDGAMPLITSVSLLGDDGVLCDGSERGKLTARIGNVWEGMEGGREGRGLDGVRELVRLDGLDGTVRSGGWVRN